MLLKAIMFICTIAYSMGKSLDSPIVGRTGMASWSLDLCVNTLGTSAIAARLWWVGRQTASLKPGNRNSYLSIAFIILESGAMFAAATFILVILYVHTPTALGAVAGINVVMQLAVRGHLSLFFDIQGLTRLLSQTLSPLLIIVRVGLNLSHGSSRNNTAYVSAPSNVNIIQANIKPTNSSTPVRVLVSQREEFDFPRDTREGDYEMHILDSDSYNQKDTIVVDAI